MDKKGGDTAGSNRSNLSGETVSPRVFAEPEADRRDTERLDQLDESRPSSALEKVEELPQRMWSIIVAGLFVWTVIAIVALLFFF